jgi:hypothetical protein
MSEPQLEGQPDLLDLARSIRAMEEHAARTRHVIEHDVVQALRAIYDQVHITRHAIERLVTMMEGGVDA